MKVPNISASAGEVYEGCPKRFEAEYVGDRARSATGDAAGIGIVDHACLEDWVQSLYHIKPPANPIDTMKAIYDRRYYSVFSDKKHYNEGLALAQKWLARQDWTGREVISTEKRDSFNIKLTDGSVMKFVYVIDRLDKLVNHPGLQIEVVDYKTVSQPVSSDDLHDKLQARAYAVAAQMMYPDADCIWVTFDLLRFNTTVGTAFYKTENRENYIYLRDLAQRIVDDENPKETLNPDCRWCVRKHICKALQGHAAVGGALTISDPASAAQTRFELECLKKGVEGRIVDLDAFLMAHMEHEELLSFSTPDLNIEATADRRRSVDAAMAADVVGPALMAKYGDLKMGTIDELMKGTELDASQKEQLKKLINYNIGKPGIKIKKKK